MSDISANAISSPKLHTNGPRLSTRAAGCFQIKTAPVSNAKPVKSIPKASCPPLNHGAIATIRHTKPVLVIIALIGSVPPFAPSTAFINQLYQVVNLVDISTAFLSLV